MQEILMKNKIICIDLDGTIANYNDWQGELHFGEPLPNVSKILNALKLDKWIIIIYTIRANIELVSGYLQKNNIPFDFINENPYQPENAKGGKLYADIYVDDKAIQFTGDWEEVYQRILKFKPGMKMINEQERLTLAIDFLNHDFDQSYEQLRHYDNLSWDITKFSFIELLAGIAAVWAIYGFALNPENPSSWIKDNYTLLIPSIFGICYIFSILATFLISRNRVYFSKVAKYINEHRNFSLSIKPIGFSNQTKFYTNIKFPPAFDKWSTHLVSLYVIQLISAIMFSSLIYCLLINWYKKGIIILAISISLGLVSFLVNLWYNINYMKKQDEKLGN
jgi:hydroxymethylpyrimidine pyrophosphatase-like HAD family hydrolase